MKYIKKNFFIHLQIRSFLNLFIIISIISKNPKEESIIESDCNYGDRQNPEIDKSYNHLLGRNIYFITEGNEKTMYATVIYPSITLEITLKMYTSSKTLINAFDEGKKLYFGFDLIIENTDITLRNYNTDIILCIFDKNNPTCYDYVNDTANGLYIRNQDGIISNNNLIPLGFQNIKLNVIKEKVMGGYEYFFGIKFEKSYPPLFDNITMFNWINYVASDTGEGIIGFYGVVDDESELIQFSKDKPIYFEIHNFEDGAGLPSEYSNYNRENLFILSLLSFALLF